MLEGYVIERLAPAQTGMNGHEFAHGTDGEAEPLPLFPPLPPAEVYPLDALGPVLSRAAHAIARKVQVPPAIAAQSTLAAASLAAQAHADVRLPYGQTRPLSLYFMTCSPSGDRKTTSDREATWPVRKREETLHDIYLVERQAWNIAMAAWGAEKRAIEANKKLEYGARKQALAELGPEPIPPLHPFLVAPDPTIEGLVKAWVNAPAALGIFSAEGGTFIGGHGMAQESRLRTAAGYSEAWDGHAIKRVRAVDGVTILRGRRLAMHLMVQPEASAVFLSDPVLRDQGLLSRILVAAPDSLAGTRRYAEPRHEDEAAIKAYGARLLSLLEVPWPLSPERSQGLEPRALPLADEADVRWRAFYDQVETRSAPGAPYAAIRDLAAKAAEHAARIAGVMTIVENLNATAISGETMADAVTLTSWYLGEAARLQRAGRADPGLLRAQALLEFLRNRSEGETSFRDILQFGPSATRTKKEADQALDVLTAHGWATEANSRPRMIRVHGGRAGQRETATAPATLAKAATVWPSGPQSVANVASVAGGRRESANSGRSR